MDFWPYEVTNLTTSEIRHSVADEEWQKVRRSMKGLPTSEKLRVLSDYKALHTGCGGVIERRHQVQIDNYINALKRGGQLDLNGWVQR